MHPADRHYQGFPGFGEWAACRVGVDLWDRSLALLAQRRNLAGSDAFETMAERAMRIASIDTGAIEGLYAVDRGFTVTVAAMASAWEAQIQREKGADVAALVAAQRAAYDMALDMATSNTEISEAWLRQLHAVVSAPQDAYEVQTAVGPQRHPLPKGEYKKVPNHVELADGSVFAYAPVEDTPAEMHRFVEELRSPSFRQAHPVLQSAYAHYAFVRIHPFADGNGRVARALASVFLFRATSLPFVLFADQKDSYLTTLESADRAGGQPFVDFVLRRAVDLQMLVAEQLREAAGTSIEDAARRLSDLASYPEVALLRTEIATQAQSQLTQLSLPRSIRWDVSLTDRTDKLGRQGDLGVRIFVKTFSPRTISLEDFVTVAVRQDVIGEEPAFLVRRLHRPEDTLEIRQDEARRGVVAVLETRIASWVRRMLGELMADLSDAERP